MATQRITVAKIVGAAGAAVRQRLQTWSAARQAVNPNEWGSTQWPQSVRDEADEFAGRMRANALALPVLHFVEWVDRWSMGDLFDRWLTPPEGSPPLLVFANRFVVYGYSLPDEGRLGRYLAAAGPQQWPETDWFIQRLQEAIEAWRGLVEQATLVVLRDVVDGSVSDEEVTTSLARIPDWLSEG